MAIQQTLSPLFDRLWRWRDRNVRPYAERLGLVSAPIEPVEDRIRREAQKRLAGIAKRIDVATVQGVLDAQIEVVRILREASATLDIKANVIIVACGALLTAFVTISPAEKAHLPPWSVAATLLLLSVGFSYGVAALNVAAFSLPTPAVYNLYSTLADPDNAGRIRSELTEAWYRYGLRERRLISQKGVRVRLGLYAVALGLLVLVLGTASGLSATGVYAGAQPAVATSSSGTMI